MPTTIPLGRFGPVKVWSVVVTILGDLAPDGAGVPGALLTEMTGGLGIQPQALRTALHRLRAEGWMESTRKGRHAWHNLSSKGRAETRAVWSLVYGAQPGLPPVVLNITDGPGTGLPLRPGLTLGPPEPGAIHALLPDTPPSWLTQALGPPALQSDAAQLADALPQLPLDPVHRVLILHAWRRMALRRDEVAVALLDRWGVQADIRPAVLAALEARPRPALDQE
ncbi:MAG: hypothetical protein ACU0CI_03860 [Shimia sp.]